MAGDGVPIERFGITRLYRDAASLASASIFNAVLGILFWGVAARAMDPEHLGVMTAVLAAINTSAFVVATSVGDAYTSLMPATGRARPTIYRRGQLVYLATSAVSGIIGGVATVVFIAEVKGSIAVAVLVAIGTVVVAGFILQNTTLVAIGRAGWLLTVTTVNSLLKILLLLLFAVTLLWHSVELATVISAGLILLVLRPQIAHIINNAHELSVESSLSHEESLHEFSRFVVRAFLAVALTMGTFALAPFLVTAFAGPREGALFALAITILQTLDFINAALGTSLVVHASSSVHDAAVMAKSILLRAFAMAVGGSLIIGIATPLALRFLNEQYRSMNVTAVIVVLCLGSVARTFYMTWAAIQRSRREMRPLLILNAIAATFLLSLIPELSHRFGALGGACVVALAQAILGFGSIVHYLFVGRRAYTKM